jgi:hypothetical protein
MNGPEKDVLLKSLDRFVPDPTTIRPLEICHHITRCTEEDLYCILRAPRCLPPLHLVETFTSCHLSLMAVSRAAMEAAEATALAISQFLKINNNPVQSFTTATTIESHNNPHVPRKTAFPPSAVLSRRIASSWDRFSASS